MSDVKDIYVRIICDKKNKRKFEKIYVEDFPVQCHVKAMKKELLERFSAKLGQNTVKSIDIGYVGYSNKKFHIYTDEDLKKAFASSSEHASQCPVFFMIESDGDHQEHTDDGQVSQMSKVQTASGKTVVEVSDCDSDVFGSPAKKLRTKKGKTEKEDRESKKDGIVQKLREIHKDKWQTGDYRLWAEAMLRGHESYAEPPNYPVFRGKQQNKTHKPDIATALKDLAKTFQAGTSREQDVPQQRQSVRQRTEILGQLKTFGGLKADGILSEDEFKEQKEILVAELKTLK